MTDPLETLWRSADAPPPPAPLDDLRDQAARLDRTLRWRDVREVGAAALGGLVFLAIGIAGSEVRGAAFATVAVSAWVAGVILAVRARFPRARASAPLRESVATEHRWLSAQTALLRWAWLWYVAPITAVVVAFDASDGGVRPVYLAFTLSLGALLAWANGRAAADLARTRDAFADLLHDLSAPDHA